MNHDLVEFSRRQIEVGSRSFNFASTFFSKRERAGAWLLYSWCRHCDDQIDQAANPREALLRLGSLEENTRRAFFSGTPLQDPQFEGLRLILHAFGIPLKYPLDLLRGMRMDVEGHVYRELEELDDYCYCVAGVVGLMMCHIMGVSSEKALPHAVAMGSAMQLTNIARDVKDDFDLGRIYFPRRWLEEVHLSPSEFGQPANRKQWSVLAQRLLRVADDRYRKGRQGLSYLSWRGALACSVAASVYRQIGRKVLAAGPTAWDERQYVGTGEKILLALREGIRLSFRLAVRLLKPWRAVRINETWFGDRIPAPPRQSPQQPSI
ncbi:MAG: phytoene synthase [Bdellovibrio sp.]|nr:MAG: phytoene synthase [Bdellovibrio sp.]